MRRRKEGEEGRSGKEREKTRKRKQEISTCNYPKHTQYRHAVYS